mmetsp:Transcript_118381/g.379514  ORF Transcript_118381/g.379514 Transcript_118381/m.379514 type:complete len:309 (+) Transcript_118381:1158-2084(+)
MSAPPAAVAASPPPDAFAGHFGERSEEASETIADDLSIFDVAAEATAGSAGSGGLAASLGMPATDARGWWQQPQKWVRSGLARIQSADPSPSASPGGSGPPGSPFAASAPSRGPHIAFAVASGGVLRGMHGEEISEGVLADSDDDSQDGRNGEAGPRQWLVGGLQVAGQGLQNLRRTSTGLLGRVQGASPDPSGSPSLGSTSEADTTNARADGWLQPIRGLIDKAQAGRAFVPGLSRELPDDDWAISLLPPLPAGSQHASASGAPEAIGEEGAVDRFGAADAKEPFEAPDFEAMGRLRHISELVDLEE